MPTNRRPTTFPMKTTIDGADKLPFVDTDDTTAAPTGTSKTIWGSDLLAQIEAIADAAVLAGGGGGGGASVASAVAFTPVGSIASTNVQTALAELDGDISGKANIASPTFTGNPAAPTPAPGDNDTSIATTQFVNTAISGARVEVDTNNYANAAARNVALPSPREGDISKVAGIWQIYDADSTAWVVLGNPAPTEPETVIFALTAEDTAPVVGQALSIVSPMAKTLSVISAQVTTPSTTGSIVAEVRVNAVTVATTTIAVGQRSSPDVTPSPATIIKGDIIDFVVTAAGSAAGGLKVVLDGVRT